MYIYFFVTGNNSYLKCVARHHCPTPLLFTACHPLLSTSPSVTLMKKGHSSQKRKTASLRPRFLVKHETKIALKGTLSFSFYAAWISLLVFFPQNPKILLLDEATRWETLKHFIVTQSGRTKLSYSTVSVFLFHYYKPSFTVLIRNTPPLL